MEKIKNYTKKVIKTYTSLTKRISPSILASSIVFYLLIVFLPLSLIIINIMERLNLDYSKLPFSFFFTLSETVEAGLASSSFIANIVLFISIVWLASKLINILSLSSDTLYKDTPRRRLLVRIASFIFMIILVFFFIALIVIFIFINYWLDYLIDSHSLTRFIIILIKLIKIILQYIIIIVVIAIIYKFIVPIKIKIKTALLTGLMVTITSSLFSIIYEMIISQDKINKYLMYYGTLANFFLFLIWLYYLCYLFILGIIHIYYVSLKNEH